MDSFERGCNQLLSLPKAAVFVQGWFVPRCVALRRQGKQV